MSRYYNALKQHIEELRTEGYSDAEIIYVLATSPHLIEPNETITERIKRSPRRRRKRTCTTFAQSCKSNEHSSDTWASTQQTSQGSSNRSATALMADTITHTADIITRIYGAPRQNMQTQIIELHQRGTDTT